MHQLQDNLRLSVGKVLLLECLAELLIIFGVEPQQMAQLLDGDRADLGMFVVRQGVEQTGVIGHGALAA